MRNRAFRRTDLSLRTPERRLRRAPQPCSRPGSITYSIEIPDGDVPAESGAVSRFIDPSGRPLSPISLSRNCSESRRPAGTSSNRLGRHHPSRRYRRVDGVERRRQPRRGAGAAPVAAAGPRFPGGGAGGNRRDRGTRVGPAGLEFVGPIQAGLPAVGLVAALPGLPLDLDQR